MNIDPPDPDDDPFGLVEQYDSIEDPDLRSEFLDAVGTTRSYINALRLRRDKAAARDASAPEASGAPRNRGPRRRLPRLRLRNRGTTGRPPRYAGSVRSKHSRNRARPEFVVIVFKLD
ncbi:MULTISPECIES: hypothetical protein [unclassified Streptomyces]|uniref:hypothetical protein n=1 Tax=unclassified Streptomyces TaxID=2593676 RepID=UPI0004BD6758|nr:MULTISPECIES: hypothetical protein [unclassified Streptomyces]MBK0376803.1 hypothetical protein [Streptomyces sp. RB110-1]MBK0386823.1 hypothetical protein [Streptomyces sp. RB110-2]